MKIVGMRGPSGSGKDYLASTVLEPLGYLRWGISFPIKVEVAADLVLSRGITAQEAVDLTFNTRPDEVREMLQTGRPEDDRRAHGSDVHRRLCAAYIGILELQDPALKIVICDVRPPEDAQMILDLGGDVLEIHAPLRIAHASGKMRAALREHFTEKMAQSAVPFAKLIDNDPNPRVAPEQQVIEALGINPTHLNQSVRPTLDPRAHHIAWEVARSTATGENCRVVAIKAQRAYQRINDGVGTDFLVLGHHRGNGDPRYAAALEACWDAAQQLIWPGVPVLDAHKPRRRSRAIR